MKRKINQFVTTADGVNLKPGEYYVVYGDGRFTKKRVQYYHETGAYLSHAQSESFVDETQCLKHAIAKIDKSMNRLKLRRKKALKLLADYESAP